MRLRKLWRKLFSHISYVVIRRMYLLTIIKFDPSTAEVYEHNTSYMQHALQCFYHWIHEEVCPAPGFSLNEVAVSAARSDLERIRLADYFWSLNVVHKTRPVKQHMITSVEMKRCFSHRTAGETFLCAGSSHLILPLDVISTRTGSNLKVGVTTSTTYDPEGTSFTAKLPSVL